ncbi:hypothetical protein HPB52_010933 [Rhipicephalus sanguineus]|uniref:Uncharacterized protein n=1 Tax=Rhipicephalus sanguineus TaxID=34632 RepID=A0A9D4SW41_RHISA|nr:hypothetical protein HPB52_010933 [Rhipicephalus sanguineus]
MTEAPEAIGQVEAQMNKDIGDLAASPIKDEQGDSKDTASPDGGHIEGHARGKPVKPERLASGETKKGEADGKAAEKPAAPGGGADQADSKLPEVVESEQTVNESSSDEDDLDDEEDESSDYTETETDDSDEEEGSQED